jgi:hypothetical protein
MNTDTLQNPFRESSEDKNILKEGKKVLTKKYIFSFIKYTISNYKA